MMNEEILRAEGLTVGYSGKPVIENISLSARVGRILTLIGPNGVGKSTILKTLIRSLPPIKGTVTLLGRDGDACIPVEEISGISERFPYEFICDIGARVPRVYLSK